MPFDTIETARVKTTGIDKNKCVTATLDNCPEDELPQCTTHQMVGFQSRPMDGKADAVYAANGDVAEVLNMEDPAATKALAAKAGAGECAKGETRMFSTGSAPNGILLKDNKFKVGTEAQKGAARLDDETNEGTISIVITPAAGVIPGIMAINYTDGLGNVLAPPLVMTIPGLAVTSGSIAPVPNLIRIRGKIVTCSNLVDVE